MDSSVSLKEEIWFLRVCHHISNAVYRVSSWGVKRSFTVEVKERVQLYLYPFWEVIACSRTNLKYYFNIYLQIAVLSFTKPCKITVANHLLLLPLALQPTVGFGLSNNVLPLFPICHQISPSSHSHHLKISFYFLFPSFPGSSPSSGPFQFLSDDPFGHPILLHSL